LVEQEGKILLAIQAIKNEGIVRQNGLASMYYLQGKVFIVSWSETPGDWHFEVSLH